MQLFKETGMTLSEAKATFDNGNVNAIRLDICLGEFYLVVCTKVGEKRIKTQRNSYKSYKSLNSIMNDFEYITSSKAKKLCFKL